MTDTEGSTSTIEILAVDEHEDGSATITFDLDDNFIRLYKKDTGKQRATKRGFEKFLLEIMVKSIDQRYK